MNQKEEMYNDKENGGGGNYHSFEATKGDRVVVLVTVTLIVFAIGLAIYLCIK